MDRTDKVVVELIETFRDHRVCARLCVFPVRAAALLICTLGKERTSVLTLCLLFGRQVDLESAFEAFDANGDGIISPAEFKRGLNKLSINLSSAQVRDLLRYMDRDGDGHVDLREFKREFGHASSSAGPASPPAPHARPLYLILRRAHRNAPVPLYLLCESRLYQFAESCTSRLDKPRTICFALA